MGWGTEGEVEVQITRKGRIYECEEKEVFRSMSQFDQEANKTRLQEDTDRLLLNPCR